MRFHPILLLSLSLVLICATGVAAEEPAATPEAPAPDAEAAITLDPMEDAELKSHCSASYNQCFDGQSVSCTGHTSCESGTYSNGNGWVECDGQRTDCGGCSAECPTSMDTCFGSNTCTVGYDSSIFRWYIECDGNRIICPGCDDPTQIDC